MVENSKIEWTDATFNPWIGCQAVSPACDHCYAETFVRRHGGDFANRRRTSVANWQKPRVWNRKAGKAGMRLRVFCASLADVFDNKVPDDWRHDLWALIAETPHLDWLLLTKRPQNIAAMLPSSWGTGWPNVWLGTTAENQTEADRRLPVLTKIPAAVHFVSVEPMLGRLRLEPYLEDVDWVICGGESGAGARHMDPDDAADLLAQCQAAGTAFFMKQMTKKAPIPPSLFVREMPTVKADRPLEMSAHA